MTSTEALASTALSAATIKYVVDVLKWMFPKYARGKLPARAAVLIGMTFYIAGFYLNKTPTDMDLLIAIANGFVAGVLASGYNSHTKPVKESSNDLIPSFTTQLKKLEKREPLGGTGAVPTGPPDFGSYERKFDQSQRT